MSSPSEQTLVMASSFLELSEPAATAWARAESSVTGRNAPESPPTEDEAKSPPFFTASLSRAMAAVLPGAPI